MGEIDIDARLESLDVEGEFYRLMAADQAVDPDLLETKTLGGFIGSLIGTAISVMVLNSTANGLDNLERRLKPR